MTGQSAQQLESGVIGRGEEAAPTGAMMPLSAVTTKGDEVSQEVWLVKVGDEGEEMTCHNNASSCS